MTLSAEMKKKCVENFNQHSAPFISLPQAWFVLVWHTSVVDEVTSTQWNDAAITTKELMQTFNIARNRIIEDQMIAGRPIRNFKVRKALEFLKGLQELQEKNFRDEGIFEFQSKFHACTRFINIATLYFIRVFDDHRKLDSLDMLFDDQARQLEFKTWGKSRCYDLMRSSYNSIYALVKVSAVGEAEKLDLLEELEIGWYMFCLKYASFSELSVTAQFWENADLSRPNRLPSW